MTYMETKSDSSR